MLTIVDECVFYVEKSPPLPVTSVTALLVTELTVTSGESITVWSEWGNEIEHYEKKGETHASKRMIKKCKNGTVQELKDIFEQEMNVFAKHVFIIRHQFRMYRELKTTLTSEEAVVHIDFSENWVGKYSAEIQSMHFGASQQQITIHTGVAYFADCHLSFASISPELQHGPQAIWAHLEPVLKLLQQTEPTI